MMKVLLFQKATKSRPETGNARIKRSINKSNEK
jgi:hypothetical protein